MHIPKVSDEHVDSKIKVTPINWEKIGGPAARLRVDYLFGKPVLSTLTLA